MDIDLVYLFTITGVVIFLAVGFLVTLLALSREKANSRTLAKDIRLKESQRPFQQPRGKSMDVTVNDEVNGKTVMNVSMFNETDMKNFENLLRAVKPGVDIKIAQTPFLPQMKAVFLADDAWAVIENVNDKNWNVKTTQEFVDSLHEVRTSI